MSRPEKFLWHRRFLEAGGLTDTTKLVGLAVWDYANPDGTNAHPGRHQIACRVGKSERAVEQSLGRLRAAGWLEKTQEAIPRIGHADVYRLTYPRGVEPPPKFTRSTIRPNNASPEQP